MVPTEGLAEVTMRVIDWLWAGLVGVLGVLWQMMRGELAEMKDTHNKEAERQREHIAKLYENAEIDRKDFRQALQEHAQASTDRHIELLTKMHEMMAGKQDK